MNLQFITTRGLLPGSRLALDILFNGIANDAIPIHLKGLAKISLELLKTYATTEDTLSAKLSAVYRPELSQIFQESIKECIGQSDINQAVAGWHLLQLLADKGTDWAVSLWKNAFPAEPNRQLPIARALLLINKSSSARSKTGKLGSHLPSILESLFPKIPLEEAVTLSIGIDTSPDTLSSDWLTHFFALSNHLTAKYFRTYHKDKGTGVAARIVTLSDEYKHAISAITKEVSKANRHPSWDCLVDVNEFCKNPTLFTLIKSAEACNNSLTSQNKLRRILPWPISQAITEFEAYKQIDSSSKINLWALHENHTQEQGMEISDLLSFSDDPHKISARGVAIWELIFEPQRDEQKLLLEQIIQAIHRGGSRSHIKTLSDLFTGICEIKGVPESIDPTFIEKNILPKCEKIVASSFVTKLSAEAKVSPSWERFYLALASKSLLPSERVQSRQLAHWCISKGTREEQLLPLLKIAGLCASHIDASTLRSAIPEGYDFLLSIKETQDTQLLASLVLLELVNSLDRNDVHQQLGRFINIAMKSPEKDWFTKKILQLLEREYANEGACLNVLDSISSSMESTDWTNRGQYISIHSKVLETGSSNFDRATVSELRLPINSSLTN